MKKFTLLAQLLLLAGICSIGYAKPNADLEAEHNALRKMKALYEDVLNNGKDPDVFAPYLAKNFVGSLATGDEVRSIEDLKAFWKKINYPITCNFSVLMG